MESRHFFGARSRACGQDVKRWCQWYVGDPRVWRMKKMISKARTRFWHWIHGATFGRLKAESVAVSAVVQGVALSIALSGCISTNSEVFEILRLASDSNQSDDTLTISKYSPEEDPVRVAADGSQLFLVVPSISKNISYVYELNGAVLEGQNSAMVLVSGSALPEGGSTLKVTVSSSTTLETATHTFNLLKNSKPSIGNPTPLLSAALPLAAGGTQNFTAAVSDADGDEITIAWTLGSDEDEALTGTTSSGTTRGIFQPSEDMVGEKSIRLTVGDGFDETVYEWPVSIVPPVEITSWTPIENPVVIGSSGTQTFAVNAEGAVGATYSWELDGVSVAGEESAFLNLANVALGGGNHTLQVSVSNAGGADSHTFNLKKNTPPYISEKSPVSNTGNTIASGMGTVFSVTAVDPDTDTLTYAWKFNGVVDGAADPLTGSGNSRTVTPTGDHVGPNQVSVTVSDGRDEITQTWTVTVSSPVEITSARPEGNPVVLRNSGTTTFEISTAGGSGITYEWYVNDVKRAGEAASSFVFTNSALPIGETYVITAKALSGTMSPATRNFNVIRNRLPTIGTSTPAASGNLVCRTCTLALSASATDADAQALTWTYKVDGLENAAAFLGSGSSRQYRPTDLAADLPRDHLVTAEVSDGVDTAQTAWSVTVFDSVSIVDSFPPGSGEVVFPTGSSRFFSITPNPSGAVQYSYSLTSSGVTTQLGTSNLQQLSYSALPGVPGSTATLTATATLGGSTGTKVFNLRKNSPPQIQGTTPIPTGVTIPYTASLPITVNAQDGDGHTLTYTWNVLDPAGADITSLVLTGHTAVDNRVVTYQPRSGDVGEYLIKVAATDGYDTSQYEWRISVAAPVLVHSWSPPGNPVKLGATGTEVFSVTLVGGVAADHSWKLCAVTGVVVDTANCLPADVLASGNQDFFTLGGATLPTAGAEYLLTDSITGEGGSGAKTFRVKKNRPLVITPAAPLDSGGNAKMYDNQITYSSSTPLVFSATMADPDSEDDVEMCTWKLDGGSSSYLVETAPFVAGNSTTYAANFTPSAALQGYRSITLECTDNYQSVTTTWQAQVVAPISITTFSPIDVRTIFGASSVKTFSVTPNMNSGVTYQYKINEGSYLPATPMANNFVELMTDDLPEMGDNQLTIKAIGGGGEATHTFLLRKNSAPYGLLPNPVGAITIPYTSTQEFWITPSDANGDAVSVSWKLDGQSSAKLQPISSSDNASLGRQPNERGARLLGMSILDASAHIVSVNLSDTYDIGTFTWSVNVIAPSTIDNYSPRDIDFPPENKIRIGAANPTTFSVTTTGASGPQYAWSINGGVSIPGEASNYLSLTSAILPNINPTPNTLRVTVTPTQGEQDSHDFTVYRNRPPVITGGAISAQLTGGTGTTVAYGPGTLDLSVSASDADSDTLTYSWKIDGISQPTLFSAQNASGSQTRFTPTSSWVGQRTISVQVGDSFDVVTASVVINVIAPVTVFSTAPPGITVFGASSSQSFSVTPLSGTGVSYSYVIDPASTPVNRVETTSYITLAGADLVASGTHFLRTILSAGGSQANHDFVLRKNQPPQINATSPDTFPQVASITIPKTILDGSGNNKYTFSVGVNDADDALGNMIYTWRLNGQTGGALISSGNTAYIIPNGMVGTHSVSVDVSDGYDSVSRTWTVTVVNPVLISTYLPSDNVRVPVSGSQTLSVVVGGSVAPTYSWYLGASAPSPCSGSPSGTDLGSALSSVVILGSQISGTANAYALVTSNGTCDAKNFTLTKNSPAVAAANTPAPAGTLVAQNGSVTFQVQATDANSDALSYTWYFDNDNAAVSLTSASPTGSYTAARTYTPQATHSLNGGTHVVKVDIWDGYDTTSYSWALTVVPPVSIVSTTPANLDGSGNPINYVFGSATSRTFSVTPSYTEGVTYSYKLNGVARAETTSYISLTGADAGLNIGNNTLEMKVSAGGASDTETFYLVKNAPPAIVPWTSLALESTTSRPRPTGLSLAWSATQAFHIEASDTDSLTYTWKLNGAVPAAGVFTGSGADVTFDPPDSAGIQTVSVVVADPYDSSTYSWSVEVLAPVDIVGFVPNPASAVFGGGSTYTFAVTPNSTAGVSYAYQLNYSGPSTPATIPIAATSPYVVLNSADLTEYGNYSLRVTASNNGSSDFQDFSLRRNTPPSLDQALPSPATAPAATINLGSPVVLSVRATDEMVDLAHLFVSWTVNGAPVGSEFSATSFNQAGSYGTATTTFTPILNSWVGTQTIRARVSDTYDVSEQEWQIQVVDPMVVTITSSAVDGVTNNRCIDSLNGLSAAAYSGVLTSANFYDVPEATGNVTFSIDADGKQPAGYPISFDWSLDGVAQAACANSDQCLADTSTLKPINGDRGLHYMAVTVHDHRGDGSVDPVADTCIFPFRKNVRPRLVKREVSPASTVSVYPVYYNTALNGGNGPQFAVDVIDENNEYIANPSNAAEIIDKDSLNQTLAVAWLYNGLTSDNSYARYLGQPYMHGVSTAFATGPTSLIAANGVIWKTTSAYFNPRGNELLTNVSSNSISVEVNDGAEDALPDWYSIAAVSGYNYATKKFSFTQGVAAAWPITINAFTDTCNSLAPGAACTLVGQPGIGHNEVINQGADPLVTSSDSVKVKMAPSFVIDDGSADKNLFVSDTANHVVWYYHRGAPTSRFGRSWAQNQIGVILGSGAIGNPANAYRADAGDATRVIQLNRPRGLVWDGRANEKSLYVADYGSSRVLRIYEQQVDLAETVAPDINACAQVGHVCKAAGEVETVLGLSTAINPTYNLNVATNAPNWGISKDLKCTNPTGMALRKYPTYSLVVACAGSNGTAATGDIRRIMEVSLDNRALLSDTIGIYPNGSGRYLRARMMFTPSVGGKSALSDANFPFDVKVENRTSGATTWSNIWFVQSNQNASYGAGITLRVYNAGAAPLNLRGWGHATNGSVAANTVSSNFFITGSGQWQYWGATAPLPPQVLPTTGMAATGNPYSLDGIALYQNAEDQLDGLFVLNSMNCRLLAFNFSAASMQFGLKTTTGAVSSRVGNSILSGRLGLIGNSIGGGAAGGTYGVNVGNAPCGFNGDDGPIFTTQFNLFSPAEGFGVPESGDISVTATTGLRTGYSSYNNRVGFMSVSADGSELYVADTGNNRVRVVNISRSSVFPANNSPYTNGASATNPDTERNLVRTLLGSGARRYGEIEMPAPASLAPLNEPSQLAYDEVSNALYFADTSASRVRYVNLVNGTIRNAAGKAPPLSPISINGGPASDDGVSPTQAYLGRPVAISFGPVPTGVGSVSSLYIVDTGNNAAANISTGDKNCVVKLLNGTSSTLSAYGLNLLANTFKVVGGDFGSSGCGAYVPPPVPTSLKEARLNNSMGIAANATDMYLASTLDHCILRTDISTGLAYPFLGVCGTLGNNTASGRNYTEVTDWNASIPSNGDPASLNTPMGLAMDPTPGVEGNFFVADYGNNQIVYVNRSATTQLGVPSQKAQRIDFTSLTGVSPNQPTVVTARYFAAGPGGAPGTVVCFANGSIREDVTTGTHSVQCFTRTAAAPTSSNSMSYSFGTGKAGGSFTMTSSAGVNESQEGISAVGLRMWGPNGLAFDSEGNLYISDRYNHVIRKVARWW